MFTILEGEIVVGEFFASYGLFFLETITVLISVLILIAFIFGTISKGKKFGSGHIEVKKINDQFRDMAKIVRDVAYGPEKIKKEMKDQKKKKKEDKKKKRSRIKEAKKKGEAYEPQRQKHLFVIQFNGDIKASAVSSLRQEITTILQVAEKEDEILLKLNSSGGMVHAYGLGASQLERIKSREIPLTISVDQVAASGGYMMACVANKLISAPFAILGSIGVVAQIPNFNRLLKKNKIDFELFTAGEFKRTVTMFGENTKKDRDKFLEEIEDTHVLFKDFIVTQRNQVDIDKVSTGEHWFGTRALKLNLVDELMTSDEYLSNAVEDCEILELKYIEKKSFQKKINLLAQDIIDGVLLRWWSRLRQKKHYL